MRCHTKRDYRENGRSDLHDPGAYRVLESELDATVALAEEEAIAQGEEHP